jgi:hypothetical protein
MVRLRGDAQVADDLAHDLAAGVELRSMDA